MPSLFWKLGRTAECKDCRIVEKKTHHSVEMCQPCIEYWKAEEVRCAALEPTEENIKLILDGEIELFACEKIYEHFYDKWFHEMPYGTAKARDGDPHQWILEHLAVEYGYLLDDEHATALGVGAT